MSETIALITGANRGIGFETARQLITHGVHVIVTARDVQKAAAACARLGLKSSALGLDVGEADSIAAAVTTLEHLHGRLDILINNAGINYDSQNLTSTVGLDFVRQTLETNLFGPWAMCQAFLPLLKNSRHPRIVNVSSEAASFTPSEGSFFGLAPLGGTVPAYSVSKVALNAFTVKLSAELAPSGVLVNAVCPGFTATYPGLEAMGARPVADGAKGIVWAALLADDGPSGGFFRDGAPLKW